MTSITIIKRVAVALVATAAICTAAPASLAVAVPADAAGTAQHAPRLDGQPSPVDDRAPRVVPSPDTRDSAAGYAPTLDPPPATIAPTLSPASTGLDLVSTMIGIASGAGLAMVLMVFGPKLRGVGLGGHGRAHV